MNVIIIHGWSDSSRSMKKLEKGLRNSGLNLNAHYFNYRSRDDEATIADYAEGLHLRLEEKGLLDVNKTGKRQLHFLTHSTGALVLRRWLLQYAWADVQAHVGNVCFLAPANFGSPLAHKGRSLLGKMTKGIREMRDFGETGKRTLEALELASPEQWLLAEGDLFGPKGCLYHAKGVRASVITGASGYGGLRAFVNEDGTDGTIVVAGAGLNSRKFEVDFTAGYAHAKWITQKKHRPETPTLILADPTHGSILDLDKDAPLAAQVKRALTCKEADYNAMVQEFGAQTSEQNDQRKRYQQFLFRLRDDRNDPIPDYHIEFGAWRRDRIDDSSGFARPQEINGRSPRPSRAEKRVAEDVGEHFARNVHVHSVDSSLRRFLIDPQEVNGFLGEDYVATLRVTADSGDKDIIYGTDLFADVQVYDPKAPGKISWVFPDTTTLIDMRVDRYTKNITSLKSG